MDTPLVFS